MEGVILSSWDHIMGPQIEKLWFFGEHKNCLFIDVSSDVLRDFNMTKHQKNDDSVPKHWVPDLEAYSVMCGQLLLGEVDSCKPGDEWASRFYISESKILVSAVFHLKNSRDLLSNESKTDKDMCLCFGAIFNRHALKYAYYSNESIDLHLRTAIGMMQNSKQPYDMMMQDVKAIVENMVWVVNCFKAPDTRYWELSEHPPFQELIQWDLMSKAIVSHIQTSGFSVVIGASDPKIKRIIEVLSLFTSPKEPFSVIAPHVTLKSYIKGIKLQGAMKTTDMDFKYLSEKASKESFSLTIVDTDLNKVWQSICVKDSTDVVRSTLSLVLENGQIVPQLLKDLAFMKMNRDDTILYIENFFVSLMMKATALIKAIEPLRSITLTDKDVMAMFAIHDPVDLKILFGCAEKLKPGFRSIL